MFEWCVRELYSSRSWMNWKPGSPTSSKATWSVPLTARGDTVVNPRSASGATHGSKTAAAAAFSWVQMPRRRPVPLSML